MRQIQREQTIPPGAARESTGQPVGHPSARTARQWLRLAVRRHRVVGGDRARGPAAPSDGHGKMRSSTRPAGVRAGRRERARPVARKSFFERYRVLTKASWA